MAVVFSDDFNRANNDTVGNGWTERGSDFDISSNTLVTSNTNQADTCHHASGASGADYDVQAVMQVSPGSIGGVVGRRVNFGGGTDSDFWAAYIGAGNSYLYKRISGGYTNVDIFARTINNGTNYTVKLTMSGNTVKGFTDGVEENSYTEAVLTAAGDCGVGNYASLWDDFQVEEAGGAADPEGHLVSGKLIRGGLLLKGGVLLKAA